ncbi:glycoside hydrolase family 3 N-terminal domain-containing protein [Galactobacter sp.]|uniref:glycoside hydrolase family 3 N-terminal domain-containing protein n=1 Tax=Galactobacter sp. TaxID=2676125 RepID=UPI0025BE5E78|nr:glycoside hydrolase family 3 N-terminal domain-containing protein [Galactobacter sp.]
MVRKRRGVRCWRSLLPAVLGLAAVSVAALAACSQGSTAGPGSAAPSAPEASPGTQGAEEPSGTAASERDEAERRVQKMTTKQKAGQVIMADVPVGLGQPGVQDRARQLGSLEIGNVFLSGRSAAGVEEIRRLTATVRGSIETSGLTPWIAVDQEGASVQTLTGNGFSRMPNALTQGGWPTQRLRDQAGTWGQQLAAAGVNMNLAPIADTVPEGTAAANPPIGYFSRQYGSTPDAVAQSSAAFAKGMQEAGVAPVLKHFPGLGLVHQNTDTTAGVTDAETGEGSDQLQPFVQQIDDGAPWIMVSSAIYPRLDPDAPATFSEPVLSALLKDDLGFDGAVISDDLCSARAVRSIPLHERAQRFFKAGGDLFLCGGGAPPSQVRELSEGIAKAAESDPDMEKALDRAAATVVESKLRHRSEVTALD